MKTPKDLIEYLFVDQPRIERYFQQLSAPVQYDKLPVWKVALGITGPSVEGSQSRPGREFSFNEKLQKVLSHMKSEALLSNTRPDLLGRPPSQPFVNEILLARRARIEREGNALNIWVSLPPAKTTPVDEMDLIGALYLIEDFRGEDDYPTGWSSFSSLMLLVHELAFVEGSPLSDPIEELRKQDNRSNRFASDPIGSLKSIGAQFGPERHIDVIYRYRASCYAGGDPKWFLTVVGYPLVIREI